MAAFQARPRTFATSASFIDPRLAAEDPLERPQSPSSSLHFGDDEASAYRRQTRPDEIPEGEREWIVFRPASPREEVAAGTDGGGGLAAGWTMTTSSVMPPHHDGSGRFVFPSPSLSAASSRVNATLDTSMYASAPTHLDPSVSRILDSERGSDGSYSPLMRQGAEDDDEIISLPSSFSLSATASWGDEASPALRPATTSLEASSTSRARSSRVGGLSARGTGDQSTSSSLSIVSSPPASPLALHSPTVPSSPPLNHEGGENARPTPSRSRTQLTASALSTVPRARRRPPAATPGSIDALSFGSSAAARVIWTSDEEEATQSEDAPEPDDEDDELSRTPHAHSAGLGYKLRPAPMTQDFATPRKASAERSGGVLTETTTSERVKRRHRRPGAGRSEDGSTKRSATGREKHRIAKSSPPVVIEESAKPKLSKTEVRKVDWVTRVARRMMELDDETVRMMATVEAETVEQTRAGDVTPKPRSQAVAPSRKRGSLAASARARPSAVRHARFSLGDSPLDLSGAYRPRYDDSDAYDSASDVEEEHEPDDVQMNEVAAASSSVTLPSHGLHAQRSLSLSSIPGYLLTALLGGVPTPPNEEPVRRTASVLWPPSTSGVAGEGAEGGHDGADGQEETSASLVRSREEAIEVLKRWWRAWSAW